MRTRRYIGSLIGVAIGLAVLAACGGGTTSAVKVIPASVSLATSAPLSSTALAQQPVATSVPAPAGYSQSVSAALVTAAANTSVSIKEGNSTPSGVPALGFATKSGGGVQTMGKVRPMSAAVYNPVYYDVITPSASITVAGTVTFTQTFPAGTLTSGTGYYLGFYDSTQASPAWQTISGPVTSSSDGLTLTFSGTVSSFTLQANEAYGFVVFSTSNGSTPPPTQSQESAYLSQGASGIAVVPETGPTSTINIPSTGVALDDSGNIYNVWAPTPGPTAVATPPSVLQRFPNGSTTANATYTSSAPAGTQTQIVETSGSGEVVGLWFNFTGTYPVVNADVWNAGSTGGAPSYTLSFQYPCNFFFEVQHDGTIVAPNYDSGSGTISYQFFAPGSSTPYRTVQESVVAAANQSMFCPNYATVGPDGTLYVTENSFGQTTWPDPYAGLYIVPPSGTEKFVATTSDVNGAGPNGVDVDAVGNIYVANNNQSVNIPSCTLSGCGWTNDSLHDVEVFSPGGASVLRHITGNYDPIPLVVAPDGTLFVGSFQAGNPPNNSVNGTFIIPSGGSTISQVAPFGETTIVLYNGTQESAASDKRHTSSISGVVSAARAGGTTLSRFVTAVHRHYAHE